MATNLIAYRGRNDDGNETTATWKAAQNTAWVQPVDVNFRVRFKVQNDTAAISNLDVKLQYNKNGAGWVDVNATSSVVRSSASANVADQANLTEQLTGGTGTFIGATSFDEVNGSCGGNSLDVTSTGKFEHEFCVQVRSADVVGGDVIQLRTINDDAETAWTTYTVTAQLSVSEAVTGVGSSAGEGAATATGRAVALTLGSTAGVGAATGVGVTVKTAAGLAQGVGAATGEGADASGPMIVEGAGSSVGVGSAQSVAQAFALAVGSGQGVSVGVATAQIIFLGVGLSTGVGLALGIPQIVAQVVGWSEGYALVLGVGDSESVGGMSCVCVALKRRR